MAYRLIVGLGNPGKAYEETRHNVGFRVVDAFASKVGASDWSKERKLKCELAAFNLEAGGKILLAKPQTFMNESGIAVQKLCSFFRIPPEEVAIVYDELNLPLGRIKLSLSGSAGGHNGVASILAHLPPRFARLRIGIGQKPHADMDLADYVLGKFTPDENHLVSASMQASCDSLVRLLDEGPEKAMNHINRQPKTDDSNSI